MRILFVNHTGACSGAENAMLRLLEALPPEYPRAVACPPGGALEAAVRERGIEHFDLPGTDLSLNLHPVKTTRGLLRLSGSAVSLRRAARRFGADVLHANTPRAGLIAVGAHHLGGPPVVVQCHDHLPRSRLGRLIRAAIAHGAEAVAAASECTAEEFNHGLRAPLAESVYVSVDRQRFSPALRGLSNIREELGLPAGAPVLAEVAQISPWKGQDTAIRAMPRIRERFDAHLLIVGDVAFSSHRYDNVGFKESLERLTRELGLESAVHFLGYRADVPELLGALDLLLLPSWDEPFGLVVAESMAVGTPVLVTECGGVAEYVEDRVSGRTLPPREPDAWSAAVIELLEQPEALPQMGREAVRTATQFNDERYCADIIAIYERAVG